MVKGKLLRHPLTHHSSEILLGIMCFSECDEEIKVQKNEEVSRDCWHVPAKHSMEKLQHKGWEFKTSLG